METFNCAVFPCIEIKMIGSKMVEKRLNDMEYIQERKTTLESESDLENVPALVSEIYP